MFPKELSEGLFSLKTVASTEALSLCVTLDSDGGIAGCTAVNSIVQPQRITYDEMDEQLKTDKQSSEQGLQILQQVGLFHTAEISNPPRSLR